MLVAGRFLSSLPRNFALASLRPAVVLLCFAGSAMHAASAQGVVIYRCTDASGALTIQNGTPCPKGSKQERRVIEALPASSASPFTAPAAPRPVVPVAPTHVPRPANAPPSEPSASENGTDSESAIADSDRLPPPWLYECRTADNDVYFSENGDPPPRCVTLNTPGLSGVVESNNVAACEMKIDQCQRVPDGALCDGWRKRLRDAESALRFGVSEDRAKAQAEVQRLTRVVRETTCGKP